LRPDQSVRAISPGGATITAITDLTGQRAAVGTASVSGELFDIWGGPVRFAFGYEHRDESTSFDPGAFFRGDDDPDPLVDDNGDGIADNDRVPFGQIAIIDPVSGSFNTDEVFAGLTIPLVGRDQDIPFLYSLELNGAIRYIDHSLAGSDPTYTVGATWQPIQDITFRGNFTRSVRAPAITEFFNPPARSLTTATIRAMRASFRPIPQRARPTAADGSPDDFNRTSSTSPFRTLRANRIWPNEKADA
jgi:outer membrane receptor protein involved in Fe transport